MGLGSGVVCSVSTKSARAWPFVSVSRAMRYAYLMDVLQLDVSGRPQSWVSPREAAVLYASDAVAWTLGDAFQVMRGGMQRATNRQSRIELHPIIAVRGAVPSRAWRQTPTLANPKLFARDRGICAYCGHRFHFHELTREPIIPVSRGGIDTWMNCITACRLYRSKSLPVLDVNEWAPRRAAKRASDRTRNRYQLALRVRKAVQ